MFQKEGKKNTNSRIAVKDIDVVAGVEVINGTLAVDFKSV
jgi:hypothetical protein